MKKLFLLSILALLTSFLNAQTHWTPVDPAGSTGLTATIIGVVQFEGEEQYNNQLEVGVFHGDVCRGTGMASTVALGRNLVFISVFGLEGEEDTFKIYDHATNSELDMTCDQTFVYHDGANTGTIPSPYAVDFLYNHYVIGVSADPTSGGTVTGGGTYDRGTTVTLTATPATGYSFAKWTKDGVQVSTSATYSFTATNDTKGDYVAHFTLNSYEITVEANPTAGGTVTGGGTFDYGTTATLEATPAKGYSFSQWTKDGILVSTNASYSFTVTEAGDYVAHFSLNSYTLTINYQYADGTEAAPTHTENINYNASYSITSPVITGYTPDIATVAGTMGAANLTVTVTYSINSYILTINYLYSDGTEAAPTHTENVNYNASYSVVSPVITGYTPDLATVAGTMGTDNVTVTVTYSINSYTLTINYLYADGTTAAPTHTETLDYNASYSVASPVITGYTPDLATVAGTMGTDNVTVTVTYSINSYTLTINYLYADGTTAAPTHTETLDYNASYSVASPVITGYTPDLATVAGTMGTDDVTVTVTYSINSYTLNINYLYADGTTAAPTHTETLDYNVSYSVASPVITGYTPDLATVAGTMGTDDVTVNVTYTINSYTLTVNYLYADGTTAAPTHTETLHYNASYSVASPVITGYTSDLATVAGTMGTDNVTVTVTYTINSYTLTINYLYADGTTAAPTHTETLDYNASYSVASPVITGYTPDLATVAGTMGTDDVTVNVTYTINSYTLTVNYLYADGSTAAPTHTETLDYNASYSIASPVITGYTPDLATVAGTMGTNNVTVTVTYTINGYILTINYIYADGTTAAPTHIENLDYNISYSVASPVITGYTPDIATVAGAMGTDNVTVTVTYTINSYTLTINYLYADGTTAAPTHTETLDYNASYSVASPVITGYTPDIATVAGTIGADNVTVTVTYSINSYTLTINYLYADGTTAAPTHTETLDYNASYSVASPVIMGYTPDLATVAGTMGTNNVTVTVTYSINSYTLTINYIYADGTTAAPTHTETLDYNASYSVASPVITGYTPDLATVAGTMGADNVTVTVTYSINSYTLTINYLYADGTTAAPTHTETLDYNALYSVASPVITGYTPDLATVAGTMGTNNVTVTVTYTINSYVITVTANPAAGGTVTGANTYNYGSMATLVATANTGYTFVNWTKDGTVVSTTSTYSFTVTETGSYVANFSLNSYDITVTANPAAGGTVTGAGTYNHFESCTLTATPATHYTFINWTKDGIEVSTMPTYSFTVTEAGDYVANFSVSTVDIVAYASQPSFGTVEGGGTYPIGSTCTLTAIPYEGFIFSKWAKGNQVVSTDAVYSFEVIEGGTYRALFEREPYYITVEVNPVDAGIVTGADGTFYNNTTCQLIAIANEGYEFVNWVKDGVVVSTNYIYDFAVTGSAHFVANFEQTEPVIETVEITAEADPAEGGTITGAGTYEIGEMVMLTATANTDYRFVNWTINGQVISESSAIAFIAEMDLHFVAHFISTVGVNDLDEILISIYPNPAEDKLFVESPTSIRQCEVFSITGERVINLKDCGEMFEIPLHHLSMGCYLIRMTSGNYEKTMEFIKK